VCSSDLVKTVRNALGHGSLSGATVCVSHPDPLDPGDNRERVQVCVRVNATEAVPDLLRIFGVSLAGEEIVACTVMQKE